MIFTFQYVSIKTKPQSDIHSAFAKDLHSNMFLLRLISRQLWSVSINEFTFQYVSIKTLFCPLRQQGVFKFTFQYVSIKTPVHGDLLALFLYLHSNMFLLRRFTINTLVISTAVFTFQYVSIKTRIPALSM